MDAEVYGLLMLIVESGGSHAIDPIARSQDATVRRARDAGLVQVRTGCWGDSDYLVITDVGRQALRPDG